MLFHPLFLRGACLLITSRNKSIQCDSVTLGSLKLYTFLKGREGEREREKAIAREKERVREGERARKNVLGTYYATKMYKTAWNETSHSKSVHVYVTFYLIKPYQPFNQTRTSTKHNQTTFSLSLCIYSHISYSSQSYRQQRPRSLYIHKAIQNFSLALINTIHNNTHAGARGATDKYTSTHTHAHTHAYTHTRARASTRVRGHTQTHTRARAHTHTHTHNEGKERQIIVLLAKG